MWWGYDFLLVNNIHVILWLYNLTINHHTLRCKRPKVSHKTLTNKQTKQNTNKIRKTVTNWYCRVQIVWFIIPSKEEQKKKAVKNL